MIKLRINSKDPAVRIIRAQQRWWYTGRSAYPLGTVFNRATDDQMYFEYEAEDPPGYVAIPPIRKWFDIDSNPIPDACEVVE